MPREASITYAEVAAAADSIKAAGGKPNQRNIRDQLGRGSYGTIVKLLRQYEDSNRPPAEPALALSAPVQKVIAEFMDQQVAGARAKLEAQLVEAQQSIDDLAAENIRQGEMIAQLEEGSEESRKCKASLEGKIEQLESDLAVAREEAMRERALAEEARVELAKAQLRLESMPRLQTELQEIRDQLKEIDSRREKAEQAAAVAKAEKEAAHREAAAAAQQLTVLQEKLDGAIDEAKRATAAAAVLDGAVKALEAERNGLTEALSLERQRAERIEAGKARAPSRKPQAKARAKS